MAVMPATAAKLADGIWSGQSKNIFSLPVFHIFTKMNTHSFCNKKKMKSCCLQREMSDDLLPDRPGREVAPGSAVGHSGEGQS